MKPKIIIAQVEGSGMAPVKLFVAKTTRSFEPDSIDAAEKVKPERLQHAIEADIEWLEPRPTRKSIAASRQGKKSD